jgi:hypothetical protein
VLQIDVGGEKRSFSRDAMLALPGAGSVEVPKDSTYGGPMTYRAVPVSALLKGLNFPPDSVIEAVATDGFVAQIPLNLMLNTDAAKSMAWLAIEPADKPWPKIAGKDYTADAFYTVKLQSQPSPASRWPEIAVDPSLPADDPIHRADAIRGPMHALP